MANLWGSSFDDVLKINLPYLSMSNHFHSNTYANEDKPWIIESIVAYSAQPQFELYHNRILFQKTSVSHFDRDWVYGMQYEYIKNENNLWVDKYNFNADDRNSLFGLSIGYLNSKLGFFDLYISGNRNQRTSIASYQLRRKLFVLENALNFSLNYNTISLNHEKRGLNFYHKEKTLSWIPAISWSFSSFRIIKKALWQKYWSGTCNTNPCIDNDGNSFQFEPILTTNFNQALLDFTIGLMYGQSSSKIRTDDFSTMNYTQTKYHLKANLQTENNFYLDSLGFKYDFIQASLYSKSPDWFFDVQKFPKEGFESLFTLFQNEQWRNAYEITMNRYTIPFYFNYKNTGLDLSLHLNLQHALIQYKQYWKTYTTLLFIPSGETQKDEISPLYGLTLLTPKINVSRIFLGGRFNLWVSQILPLHIRQYTHKKDFINIDEGESLGNTDYTWSGGTEMGLSYSWPE
jgi:hypothetical protein